MKKIWQSQESSFRSGYGKFKFTILVLDALHGIKDLDKKSLSALALRRMLVQKRYNPTWFMMHKIRSVTRKRDEKYKLKETLEFDEGFFERVDNIDGIKKKYALIGYNSAVSKRGSSSERQTKVMLMVESEQVYAHQKWKTK